MIPLAHPAGAGGVPVPGNGPERPVVAHHQRAARPHAPHIPPNLPNPAPRRPGRQPSPQAILPYVSRRPHSLPHRSVGGNVAFGLRMAGLPAERVAARVSEVLDWVGLEGYEERAVGPLSGGEQQRVALARSLAPAPRLLMLDEPVGSLDRTLRRRLVGELRELLRNLGVTAVYVTHDQEEAFSVADRVVVMRQGRVAQLGHPEEVWRRPVDEWVARFLGLDAVVEAEVKDGWAEAPWGRFPVPPGKVGSHRLLLRPDALSLSAQKRALSGVVRSRVFSGGRYLLTVDIVGGPSLELQVDCDAEADVGDMVGLDVDPARIVFLLGSGGVS